MSDKKFRVVDPGDTMPVIEDLTEQELSQMLFESVIDSFHSPVLVDRQGKMFMMNVKFFVVPCTKKQKYEARVQLGLCRKHLRDDCKKCIKSRCDDPDCLGWHVEGKGIVEPKTGEDIIQRCDDCARFEDDEMADKHVRSKKGVKELRKYLKNLKSGG